MRFVGKVNLGLPQILERRRRSAGAPAGENCAQGAAEPRGKNKGEPFQATSSPSVGDERVGQGKTIVASPAWPPPHKEHCIRVAPGGSFLPRAFPEGRRGVAPKDQGSVGVSGRSWGQRTGTERSLGLVKKKFPRWLVGILERYPYINGGKWLVSVGAGVKAAQGRCLFLASLASEPLGGVHSC